MNWKNVLKNIRQSDISELQGKEKRQADENDALYWILLGAAAFIGVAFCIVRFFHLEEMFSTPCLFFRLTGYYCPGCGGTRALKALLAGRLLQSLRLHPLVPYGAAFLAVFLGSNTLERFTGGRVRGLRYKNRYLVIGIVILLANWIIKNCLILLNIPAG